MGSNVNRLQAQIKKLTREIVSAKKQLEEERKKCTALNLMIQETQEQAGLNPNSPGLANNREKEDEDDADFDEEEEREELAKIYDEVEKLTEKLEFIQAQSALISEQPNLVDDPEFHAYMESVDSKYQQRINEATIAPSRFSEEVIPPESEPLARLEFFKAAVADLKAENEQLKKKLATTAPGLEQEAP